MEVLQWINEVLLHFHVQGVLNLAKLTHGFPNINQSKALKNKDTANSRQQSVILKTGMSLVVLFL